VYYLLNEKEKRRKHESDWRKQKRGGPKNEERTGWAEHDSDVAAEGVEGMVRELKAAMSAAAALVGGWGWELEKSFDRDQVKKGVARHKTN
jgi:hypothetical protein